MEPQGTVWLRIGQVSDNDHQGQTVMSRLITGVRVRSEVNNFE